MRRLFFLLLTVVSAVGLSSCCRPCRPVKPLEIRGERWGLLELNGKVVDRSSTASPVSADRLTLVLGEDGRLAGRGDCNGFSAVYTLDDQRITINSIASTRILCPNQTLENDYFRTLERAVQVKIDGDFLLLTDENGKLIASFQRIDE